MSSQKKQDKSVRPIRVVDLALRRLRSQALGASLTGPRRAVVA